MNTEDLKKLLAEATPGPWHVGHNELGDAQGPMSIWPDPSMVGGVIARCGPQGMSQGWFEQPAKDAALIVAAVNALPELLAERDRLREALNIFVKCIYPTDASIDSRGYCWSEAWLDEALPIARAALAPKQESQGD